MKRFLSFLATGAIALSLTSLASAQTRGIAGGSLILDDGSGHTLTIETPAMTCNSTYVLPLIPCGIYDGNIFQAGLLPPGNAEGQMLYWNMENSAWQTLNIGEVGQVLTVNGSDPSWMAPTTGGTDLPAGDIPVSNGTNFVASSLTDNGTVNTSEDLFANSLNLPNTYSLTNPAVDNLTLSSIDNTFNIQLNTDNIPTGAGAFTLLFDVNGEEGSPQFQFDAGNMEINSGNTEIDLNGNGGSSGQFMESQGSGFTPTWANAVTEVDAGTGLTGGPITTTGTLSIATTGVESGSYGDASDIPQFTVNDEGQLTSAGTVAVLISNENLTNSSITIGTLDGSGLAGGGSVSLGNEIDLSIGDGGVTNSMLANDAVTVNAGAGMSGGGTVTLGGAPITLTNAGVTSVTGTANEINTTATTGDITLSLPATIDANTTGTAAGITSGHSVGVANGGTGLSATPTNGQLPIGNGTGYTLATLTAGTNVTITNGAGSITINSTGGSAGNGEIVGGIPHLTSLAANDWHPASVQATNAASGAIASGNVMMATRAGTIKNLFVGVGATSGNNGHYWTFTIHDVTSNTDGPSVTQVGGMSATGSDVATTLTVAAGDLITMVVTSHNATATTDATWTFEMQ